MTFAAVCYRELSALAGRDQADIACPLCGPGHDLKLMKNDA
jgi:hypothetical protein